MSIIRFFNKSNQQPGDLIQVLDYINNEAKTPHARRYNYGVGSGSAFVDMRIVKILYRKEDKRQYFHWMLSFDRGVKREKAFNVAKEAMTFFGGNWQYSLVLHENTGNLHVHSVMNSVGIDGKKYEQSKTKLQKFKDYVNRLLIEEGLSQIGKVEELEEIFEEHIIEDVFDESALLWCNNMKVQEGMVIGTEEYYQDTGTGQEDSIEDGVAAVNRRIDEEIRTRHMVNLTPSNGKYTPITFWASCPIYFCDEEDQYTRTVAKEEEQQRPLIIFRDNMPIVFDEERKKKDEE